MRILSIGFEEDFTNKLQKELEMSFICIIDIAKNMYDASNFTDFRYYELIIVMDENKHYVLNKYITKIKKKKHETKVIIASTHNQSQLILFNIGADDVICHFINSSELMSAKILSNMRKLFESEVRIDRLIVDINHKKVEFDNKLIPLSGKTFDILAYLALRQEKVFSKDEIINALWEEPEYVSDNTVEVAINQIRKKLKSILGFQIIHTVRRRGYKFSY